MSSIFDKLFEGKSNLTAAEYHKQTGAIEKIVEENSKKLDDLEARVSDVTSGLKNIERNLFLKSIAYIRNVLDGIKPKALTVKAVQDLKISSKSIVDKKEQGFYQAIKAQYEKLNKFNNLYKELEQKIDDKIKLKPELPLMAFNKGRNESKDVLERREAAEILKDTEISSTRPKKHQ